MKAIELLVLLAALAGVLAWAHHCIYTEGYDAAKAERQADDDAALRVATAQFQHDQRELSNKFLLAQRDRFAENQNAQSQIEDLRRRVQSGAVRLQLKPGSAVCSIPAPADPGAGPRPGAEVGSLDLMPGTADAFVSIGGRVAAGVRRENALIDAYNTARAACNASGDPIKVKAAR